MRTLTGGKDEMYRSSTVPRQSETQGRPGQPRLRQGRLRGIQKKWRSSGLRSRVSAFLERAIEAIFFAALFVIILYGIYQELKPPKE